MGTDELSNAAQGLPRGYSSSHCSFKLQMTKSLAHQFAEYTCGLRFEELSGQTVNEVNRRIIDSIGSALGACNEETCRLARTVATRSSPKHTAPPIGYHRRRSPQSA